MIVNSLGRYLFLSVHEHKQGPIRGRFLEFLALHPGPELHLAVSRTQKIQADGRTQTAVA
jgi:hypothetical protein